MYYLALFVTLYPLGLVAVIVEKDCSKKASYKYVYKIVDKCNFMNKYTKFLFVTLFRIKFGKKILVDSIDFINKPAIKYVLHKYKCNLSFNTIKIFQSDRYIGVLNYIHSNIRVKKYLSNIERGKNFNNWSQAKRYILLKRKFGWSLANLIISFEEPFFGYINSNFKIVDQY